MLSNQTLSSNGNSDQLPENNLNKNDSRIIRHRMTRDFSILPNDLLQDMTISHEARSFLFYALSLPEDWVIKVEEVKKTMRWCKDKTHAIFRELASSGYLKSVQRYKNGLKNGLDYYITDSKNFYGSLSHGLPENRPHTKKDVYTKKKQTKKVVVFATYQEFKQAFESLEKDERVLIRAWEVYKDKKDTVYSLKKWVVGVMANIRKEIELEKQLKDKVEKRKEYAKRWVCYSQGGYVTIEPEGLAKCSGSTYQLIKWDDDKFWRKYDL